MKRILIVLLSLLIICSLVGCGNKSQNTTAKTKTSTQTATVPNTDDNGQQLNNSDKQMIANGEAVDAVVKKYVDLVYNTNPKTIDDNISQLKSMSTGIGFAGDNTDKFILILKNEKSASSLVSYKISSVNFEAISDNKGTTYKDGAIATFVVNYLYDGKKYIDDDKLYVTNLGNGSWKVVSFDTAPYK